MEWQNFTFIGLGLIGGSIAKAIKKNILMPKFPYWRGINIP